MRNILNDINDVIKQLKGKELFFFMNYDGTLTTEKRMPELAILSSKTKKLIHQLTMLPNCKVAILSGRSVLDLKHKIGLKQIMYVGNHGLEIRDSSESFSVWQSRELRYALWDTYRLLGDFFPEPSGLLIENKKSSLSINYSMASPAYARNIKAIISGLTTNYVSNNLLKLNYRKKVIEIMPALNWNKGTAARYLFTSERVTDMDNTLPICIGNDESDEELFDAFKTEGLNIKVGNIKNSHANYYLKNPGQVHDFLTCLYEAHKENLKEQHCATHVNID